MSEETYIIIGAGQGAGQAVTSLRSKGFEGRIVLIGEEPYAPYQRPPLSKKFLAGEMELDRLYVKPLKFYDDKNIDVKLNTRVTKIDRGAKEVELSTGERITYDKALIMTGTRVRELNIPGSDLKGIHYLRSIEDVDGLRDDVAPGKKMVVIGGGFIGLEVAAVAKKLGLEVTVVELADRVMARAVGEDVSKFFQDMHAEEGVTIRMGLGVDAYEGDGSLQALICSDGSTIDADVAVVGVGILPNEELAAEAGLDVDNGIIVNELCQTSDPDIYAAGDITNHPNPILGRRLRLESVHNAVEQAKTAASAMCGEEKPYAQVPWFWSDQYDVKLQTAGLSQGYDQVVIRGHPAERKFAAFYLQGGKIIAVDAINAVPEYMQGRKLIDAGAIIDPTRLADTSINMKEMLSA